jgi:hypothetical protein
VVIYERLMKPFIAFVLGAGFVVSLIPLFNQSKHYGCFISDTNVRLLHMKPGNYESVTKATFSTKAEAEDHCAMMTMLMKGSLTYVVKEKP